MIALSLLVFLAPADPTGLWASENGWLTIVTPNVDENLKPCWRVEWYTPSTESWMPNAQHHSTTVMTRVSALEFHTGGGRWVILGDTMTLPYRCGYSPLFRPRKR